MKNLIFCFDGTSNDPADATQEKTSTGGIKDSSVSNVLKLHLLFGGDLKDGNAHGFHQLSLYYPGVGTYGNKLKQILNSGLALKDPGRIINEAKADLATHYQPGDEIFIFGFSRGAAIARKFASVINKGTATQHKIKFLGVFDTVASIGMPDLNTDEREIASDVKFENRTVSSNVKEALHLCSIDDKRKAFQPTLMNNNNRVTEMWFAGAHSDVGGGYHRDGLSDNTLRFMIDEIERRKLGLVTIAPSEVKYKDLNASKDDIELGFDDLVIEPNIFGKNHQQTRPWVLQWTLYDRRVIVIEKDKITKKRPKIHHTVAERIYGDIDYRPVGLKEAKHQVIYPDNTDNNFDSLGHHVRIGMRSLRPLKKGESIVVPVMAHQYHNRTGVLLEKGVTYSFKVKANQKWKDGGIICDADGWKRDRPGIGWIKELAIGGMEPFRRQADANWFKLIGAVGTSDNKKFIIGTATVKHAPTISDEFCPFANDLKRMYGNNEGRIYLTVKRIG